MDVSGGFSVVNYILMVYFSGSVVQLRRSGSCYLFGD